jgi:hypothetical protein
VATKIRDLFVKLGVKTDAKALKRFDAGLNKAAVATVALTGIAVSTALAGDSAAKTAKQLGVGVEELQELTFAADRSGASMKDLETGIRRLAVVAVDAAEGTGAGAEAFAALGISATDAEGELKDPLKLFEEVAGSMATMENETQKMALANDVFGRSGAKLLPLLNEGADGIQALRAEARAYGLVMSKEATEASEAFVDTMTNAKGVLTGLKNTIGIALIPVLDDVIGRFTDWFLANRELIQVRAREWAERLASAAERLAGFIMLVAAAVDAIGIDNLLTGLESVVAAFVAFRVIQVVVGLVQMLAVAFGVTAGAMALTIGQVLLVVAAVVAVGLAIDDLIVFLRGGKSMLGEFVDANKHADGALGSLARALEWVQETIQAITSDEDFLAFLDDVATTATAAAEALGLETGGRVVSEESIARRDRDLRRRAAAGDPTAISALSGAASNVGASGGNTSTSNTTQTFNGGVTMTGMGLDAAGAERVARGLQADQLRQAGAAFSAGAI